MVGEYLRVTFLGKDEKTRELVNELNQHIANEQRMVVAITYEQSKQAVALASTAVDQGTHIENEVLSIGEGVKDISESLRDGQARQVDQRMLDQIKSTLFTTAVEDTDDWYSLNRKTLLSGSGAWLQRERLFDFWLHEHAPALWIFGGPGSGKTMLSTWLITLLLQMYTHQSDVTQGTSIGYFYIREDKESLRNPNLMLKTMAWQLQQTDIAFRKHVSFVCQISRDTARAEDTWENIFLKFYQSPAAEGHRTILVIDGLDEANYDARLRLLTLIKEYVAGVRSGQPHRIQFAIFGRTTLRSDLHSMNFDREEKIINVSPVKNHEDLSNYISDRIEKLAVVQEMMKNKKSNGKDRAKKFTRGVRKRVLDGADGVFLWVCRPVAWVNFQPYHANGNGLKGTTYSRSDEGQR